MSASLIKTRLAGGPCSYHHQTKGAIHIGQEEHVEPLNGSEKQALASKGGEVLAW